MYNDNENNSENNSKMAAFLLSGVLIFLVLMELAYKIASHV